MKSQTITIQSAQDILEPVLTRAFKGKVKTLHEALPTVLNLQAETAKCCPTQAKTRAEGLAAAASAGDDRAFSQLLEAGGVDGMIGDVSGMHKICKAREATFNKTLASTFASLETTAKPFLEDARHTIATQERETLEALGLPPAPPHNPRMLHRTGESTNTQFVTNVATKLSAASEAAKSGRNPFAVAGPFIQSCIGL